MHTPVKTSSTKVSLSSFSLSSFFVGYWFYLKVGKKKCLVISHLQNHQIFFFLNCYCFAAVAIILNSGVIYACTLTHCTDICTKHTLSNTFSHEFTNTHTNSDTCSHTQTTHAYRPTHAHTHLQMNTST